MSKKTSDNVGDFFSAYIWLKDDKYHKYNENLEFLDFLGVPPNRRIYISKITPTVIALIDQKELQKAKGHPKYLDYSLYEFDQPKNNEDDILLRQIGADGSTGTSSPLYNNGNGYSGDGVKVGVIAAENLTYIPDSQSLDGKEITVLPSALPPRQDSHPTAVMSQIGGNRITVNEINYRGVVPDSELIFFSAKTTKNVYEAIERMIELGAKVINYSAGIIKGAYSDFDRQVDRLIIAGNFLFVTVSGNTRQLTSPGRALNGIAVGNLVTKDYPNAPLLPPWKVWCQSEDSCSGFSNDGVHKPDLVAPGAWTGYVDSMGELNFNNFGTSFACPWVSGMGAVLYEATEGRYSYLTIKALILMSCDSEKVASETDPQTAPYIRLRSGYGALNGKRALDILERAKIYESRLEGEYNIEIEGGTLEIMLVYEKGNEMPPEIIFDEEIYSAGDQNTLLIKTNSAEGIFPLSVIGSGGGRFSLIVTKA